MMAAKKSNVQKRWYVAHTNARAERLAQRSLEAAGYETFYPWFWGTVNHARKEFDVMRPLFPRYLFLAVQEGQGLYEANTAIGVSIILHGSDGPFEVPDEDMQAMMARCDEFGQVDPPHRRSEDRTIPPLPMFSRVTVVEGPLKGAEGMVTQEDDGKRPVVGVTIGMLGRPMEALLPVECLAWQGLTARAI